MQRIGEHAVVVGASMAGLLAARVLADAYERVTVIERDRAPGRRRGSPRGSAGRARPHAAAARPGVPGGAAAGRRRRADRGGRADVYGDERDARRPRRAPVRARRARGPLADREPAAAGGPRPPPRARARQCRAARPHRRPRARAQRRWAADRRCPRAEPRRFERGRDAAGGSGGVRDRPRRARARVARGARPPAAGRAARGGRRPLRHPPSAAPGRRARRRQAGARRTPPGAAAHAVPLRSGGRALDRDARRLRPSEPPARRPRRLAGVRRHGRPARGRRGDARRRAAR